MNNFSFKNVLWLTIIGLLGIILWYVLKPYDYTVSFKSKALFGTINQTIKLWNVNLLNKSEIIEQKAINDLTQSLKIEDEDYIFHWQFSKINDSINRVKIGIKNSDHSFKNRMQILFNKSSFENKVKTKVSDFINILNLHLGDFKVKVEGEVEFPNTYCAYVPIKTKQFLKAKGMMQNYGLLNSFLEGNGVILNGNPLVEITHWDTKTDSIQFNFCYPIIKQDSLPKHKLLKYKELKSVKAIKAIYNGNYITSDRAWYALLNFAEKNKIKVKNTPIEVFKNNPNMGGNELNWQAEIYLPYKPKNK